TQVLSEETAVLTEPSPSEFAAGILQAIENPAQSAELGRRARTLAETKYSYEAYLDRPRRACGALAPTATPRAPRKDAARPSAAITTATPSTPIHRPPVALISSGSADRSDSSSPSAKPARYSDLLVRSRDTRFSMSEPEPDESPWFWRWRARRSLVSMRQ